jgi:divalent metal cation (Fe/Co/Zn/Cd) transporter
VVEVTGGNRRKQLLVRGRRLESATLGWNVVGVFVLAYAAIAARSVALAGFGLDSLIEIGASTVVLWELADVNAERQPRAMRLIGFAFVGLALYLGIQSTVVLVIGFHPHHSVLGITWTALTAAAMFGLAFGKGNTGAVLGNPVLRAEGRITLIDGILAFAVFVGLVLNAWTGWWWADPLAAYVLLYYAVREARESLSKQ